MKAAAGITAMQYKVDIKVNSRNLRYLAGAAVLVLGTSHAAPGPGLLARDAFATVQPQLFANAGAFSNAWGDYDGDGKADLAVGFKSGEVRLYRNGPRGFVDVSGSVGLTLRGPEVRALAWGDYDGDGDLDLFIGARDRVYLMRNDGGVFKDVTIEVGLSLDKVVSRQATWIDYDNDGDLDLHLASRAGVDFLFRNEGGRFTEVAAEAGLADTRKAVGACWFDMNGDGYPDLFVAHQDGDTDAFYRNDKGRFTDVAPELHMDRADRKGRTGEGSVGCAVADYDNDGDLDLFVAAYGTSMLYRNDGGRFTDVARGVGLVAEGHAVSASWGDYDNDGNVDLYVTNYHGESNESQPAVYLFRNLGGRFENVMASDNPVNVADHGVQWVDYDRDGNLDLSLTRGYTSQGGSPVFHNQLARGARGRSLQVVVLDAKGHPRPGSEVRLFDRSGQVLGTRLVMGGDGYNAQSAIPAHFGLARLQKVTVEVTYLTAAGRVTQRIEGVDPNKQRGRALIVRQR